MPDPLRFHGGVHPWEGKDLTNSVSVQDAPLLDKYVVLLQQHIGAPPKPVVKKKDHVLRGQVLAEPGGFVSAAIHAPTSGTVTAVSEYLAPTGVKVPAIEIESDGEDTPDESMAPIADWRNASV